MSPKRILFPAEFTTKANPMARVTLTIEGNPQEVRRTMRKLLGPGRHATDPRGPGGPGGQPRVKREPWTAEELGRIWSEITVGARRVLAEIATQPSGYPSAELQKRLEMDGKAIGGTLSSVGVVSRRFEGRPPVYRFRWDEYRMPPPVAEVIHLLQQGEPTG